MLPCSTQAHQIEAKNHPSTRHFRRSSIICIFLQNTLIFNQTNYTVVLRKHYPSGLESMRDIDFSMFAATACLIFRVIYSQTFASSARKILINILPSFGLLPEQKLGKNIKFGYSCNYLIQFEQSSETLWPQIRYAVTKRRCTTFPASIKTYEDAMTELKREGKGFTKNDAVVSPEGKM